jgi:hypothetical protein
LWIAVHHKRGASTATIAIEKGGMAVALCISPRGAEDTAWVVRMLFKAGILGNRAIFVCRIRQLLKEME